MICLQEACTEAIKAAEKAGQYIASRRGHALSVERKAGVGLSQAAQVVTDVDRQAEAIIQDALNRYSAEYALGWLAEEGLDNASRMHQEYFWCVDPMDGTLAFINGDAGVAVAIALVRKDGVAVVGVVLELDTKNVYSGIRGRGAWKNGKPLNVMTGEGMTWLQDRSNREHPNISHITQHMQAYAHNHCLPLTIQENNGGAVMNACWALALPASVYFKLPKPTQGGGCIWDYAASACIFLEAGGIVQDAYGQPLNFNSDVSIHFNHCGVFFSTDVRWLEVMPDMVKTK